MFCIKISFFGAGAGLSRAFIGGAGAEKKYLEPEPGPRKMTQLRNNGLHTQIMNNYDYTGTATCAV